MAVNAHSADHSAVVERRSNRRTIIKGAAWTVPVIAAAVAAPAASASGEAVVERFEFNANVSTPSIGGVVQNVTFNGANVRLEGPVGTSSGVITLVFTFPEGYETWSPVAESYGWTVAEGIDGDGFKTVTFTHPGISVTTAGEASTVWFAGIVMEGSGADRRNRAYSDYSCENYTGGGNYAP